MWRRLIGFNLLAAFVLGIGGWFLGHWIGTRITIGMDSQLGTDQNDVATFMDSHCTRVCKLEGPTIGDALRQVGARRPVTLLVVSVNPWEDTAASSRSAGARYDFGGDWHWLRGRAAQLRPIWRAGCAVSCA